MAIEQVSSPLRTENSGATSQITGLGAVTVGRTIVVPIGNYPAGIASMSDNQGGGGNTYTKLHGYGDDNNNFAELWAAPVTVSNGSPLVITVTPSLGSGNYLSGIAWEESGLDNSNLLDRWGTGANSLTASTSPNATQQANERAITIAVADVGSSNLGFGTPSGYTLVDRENDSNTYTGLQIAQRLLSATGVQSATHTAGQPGSSFDAIIVTLRLASGGTTVELTGAAVGGATASGSISKTATLAGTASGGASAAGSLTHEVPLAGSAVSTSIASGQLSVQVNLSGAAFAGALAAAQMSHGVLLSGAASGAGQAAATLSLQVGLSGAALASVQASGSLSKHVSLSGDAVGGASAAGSLVGTASLTGDAVGGAQAGGTLSLTIPLTAQAVANSLATGQLSVRVNLDGDAIGGALAGGTLSVTSIVQLQGAAVGGASASGSLTVVGANAQRIARMHFAQRSRSASHRESQRRATFSERMRSIGFKQD